MARTNHGRGRTRELAGVDEERSLQVVQEPGSGAAMHQAWEPASNHETAYRARRHIGLDGSGHDGTARNDAMRISGTAFWAGRRETGDIIIRDRAL